MSIVPVFNSSKNPVTDPRHIPKKFETVYSSAYTLEGLADMYSLLNNLNFPIQSQRLPPFWKDHFHGRNYSCYQIY